MDKAVTRATALLPAHLTEPFKKMSDLQSETVREIRLRVGTALTLSTDAGERFLLKNGQLSAVRMPTCLWVEKEDVQECVKRLCDFALHVHQQELSQGYLTVNGCRAGLGGRIVETTAGAPLAMRDITSVCLRVAREHRGYADKLLQAIERSESGGILLCGIPGSGKTSLLRDVAQGLSVGRFGGRRRVAVVDERSELMLGDALSDCDVLCGGNKAEGIERAVRCLSPEFIVFDEWTSTRQTQAVLYALSSGVRVVTGVHAPSFSSVKCKEYGALLTRENFSVVAELSNNHTYTILEEEAG